MASVPCAKESNLCKLESFWSYISGNLPFTSLMNTLQDSEYETFKVIRFIDIQNIAYLCSISPLNVNLVLSDLCQFRAKPIINEFQ